MSFKRVTFIVTVAIYIDLECGFIVSLYVGV